jgi:uncharacterized membrane protein
MMTGLRIGGISLATIFGLATLVALVFFIVYASEWSDSQSDNMAGTTPASTAQQNKKTRTEFAYYAAVIGLLFLLTGMHSFVIARELL